MFAEASKEATLFRVNIVPGKDLLAMFSFFLFFFFVIFRPCSFWLSENRCYTFLVNLDITILMPVFSQIFLIVLKLLQGDIFKT